jgi:hypothetical protein
MIKDYLIKRQAFERLVEADYKYKGKSIIWRTMRTMIDIGHFKTAKQFGGSWYIENREIRDKIESQMVAWAVRKRRQ